MSLLRYIFGDARKSAGFSPRFLQRPALGNGNAPQFAYESLALAPMTPIGPATDAWDNFETMQPPQVLHAQKVLIAGIPTEAGQIEAPSLYVPKG